MSFILAVVMSIIAVLAVLVLAATASFPSRALSDDLSPEGEWAGPARMPGTNRAPAPATSHRAGAAPTRQLKIHSWI